MPKSKVMSNIVEIIELYQKYRDTLYTALRERQNLHDQLYWCDFSTGLDADVFRAATKPPRAKMMVDTPVNHIAMDAVTVNMQPSLKGPSGLETKQAREEADKKERWLQAVVDDWSLQQPYFLREIIKNQGQRGEAYLKLSLTSAYVSWLRSGGGDSYEGNPFRLDVPDAITVMSSLDLSEGCLPAEVFEEKVITVGQLRRLLREFHEGGEPSDILPTLTPTDMVSLVEWWTPEWRGYFAGRAQDNRWDAVPVKGQEAVANPAGKVLYIRGFSGYGRWPRDGDPALLAVGILTGWETSIIEEARLLTMIDTISAKHAVPPVLVDVPEGVELKGVITVAPGKVILQEHGIKISYLQGPPVPDVIKDQLYQIQRMFEAFMPGITTGQRQETGEAAISMAMRLNQSGLLWECMYISARRMISKALELVLYLMENVLEHSVELRGLRLRAEDIKGYYKVDVDIKPGNPDQIKWDVVQGMQLKGHLPRGYILEKYFHVPDATQMLAELDADRLIESSPAISKFIAQEAMRRLGMKQELGLLEEATPTSASPLGEAETELESGSASPTPGAIPGVGGSPRAGAAALPEQEIPMPDLARLRALIGR